MKRFSIYIPEPLVDDLDRAARDLREETGLRASRNAVIESLLRKGLRADDRDDGRGDGRGR